MSPPSQEKAAAAASRSRPQRPRPGRSLCAAVAGLVGAATVAGCATQGRLPAVPSALAPGADPGIGEVRYPVARDVSGLARAGRGALHREQAWRAAQGLTGPLPPGSLLAISGGGDGGAFAAGFLNGWTAHGDRPEFEVVTGVSTGALIAPLAFLGPRYDGVLSTMYTQISQRDIYRHRRLFSALFADSIEDTTPLRELTRRYVDRKLLDDIAAEYAKGRLLFVGTTDLDTPEPVIWNMTAIAASQDPHAVDLFREVLLASAAVPGMFPPVLIDVTVDGVKYQEMHVDGSTIAQVFSYPPNLRPGEVAASVGVRRPLKLYVIENVQLDPQWTKVERRTLPIATRAITTLTQAQGAADLDHMYHLAQRDHVEFNLALIPKSFDAPHAEPFDTAYMRSLYRTGYDLGATGYSWRQAPPDAYAPMSPVATQGRAQPLR